MSHIFVSHATEDDRICDRVCEALERALLTPWADHRKGIPVGEYWSEQIGQAVSGCQHGLLLLSYAAKKSRWCQAEWTRLIHYQEKGLKGFFVAIIEPMPVEDIPLELSIIQNVDLTSDFDAAMNELIEAMGTHIPLNRLDGSLGATPVARSVPIPVLKAVEKLDSAIEGERVSGIQTLYDLRDNREAIQALGQAVLHINRTVRVNAANRLAAIGTPEAIARLRTEAATKSLLGVLDDPKMIRYLINPLLAICTVETLIVVLKGGEMDDRRVAAQALGNFDDPSALEALITAAHKDIIVDVRKAAVKALGQIGGLAAIEAITTVIYKDGDKHVLLVAIETLARIGGISAFGPLITALRNHHGDVRIAAAQELGRLGNPVAVEPLTILLRDKTAARAAVEALRQINTPEAREALHRAGFQA